MKKIEKRAFTIVEMLVTLVISVVSLFAILSVFDIGQNSYNKLKTECQVQADAYFALDLMKNIVRRTYGSVTIETRSDPPWKSQVLVIGNSGFGLYQPVNNQPLEFIYMKDLSKPNERDRLLANLTSGNLVFVQSGGMVTAQFSGQKGKNSFYINASTVKRN